MKTPCLLVSLLLLLPAWTGLTQPTIPTTINYQGQLADATGTLLTNRDYTLTFSIWSADTGGTLIWGPQIFDGPTTQGHRPKVPLVGGRFNVELGPEDIIMSGRLLHTNLYNYSAYYLEITVETNAPISPRQRILSAPFALRSVNSDRAADSDQLAGFGWDSPGGEINGSRILGTLPDARLSGNVALRAGGNAFTGNQTVSGGNVGIGTASPGVLLDVVSGSQAHARLFSADAQNGSVLELRNDAFEPNYIGAINFLGEGGWSGQIGCRTFGELVFRTGPSDRMWITASGRVGIGTSNPGATLDVTSVADQPQLRLSSQGNAAWCSFTMANGNGHNWNMNVIHTATPDIRWYADGAIKVQFNYDGTCRNASGVWSIFSDRRLKKDIRPMDTGSLGRLLQLQGVTYDYLSDEHRMGFNRLRRGWVAQQVEEVFPEWVSEGSDGMKMVTAVGFDALVVEALRELRAEKDSKLAELQQANAILEKQLDELRQQLAAQLKINGAMEDRFTALEKAVLKMTEKSTATFATNPQIKP